MKYDDKLNPIPDGRNDDGASGDSITFSRAAASGSGSGGGSDPGSEAGDAKRIAPSNGGMGNDEGADDELPLGVPFGNVADARANDPARSRRGRGRGRGNASGSRTDTGASAARGATGTEEAPVNAGGPAPRPVKLETLAAKPTAKETLLNKKFVAEGYVLAFDAVGYALHDKETWSLERDGDAAELAERTLDWFRTLDKSRSARLEKMLAKWQPFLMLLMALVAIVGPRIAQTSAKRKKNAQHIPPKTGAGAGAGTGTGNGSSPAGVHAGPVAQQATIRPEPTVGVESLRTNERPLRRQDFAELFGETLTG